MYIELRHMGPSIRWGITRGWFDKRCINILLGRYFLAIRPGKKRTNAGFVNLEMGRAQKRQSEFYRELERRDLTTYPRNAAFSRQRSRFDAFLADLEIGVPHHDLAEVRGRIQYELDDLERKVQVFVDEILE